MLCGDDDSYVIKFDLIGKHQQSETFSCLFELDLLPRGVLEGPKWEFDRL